MKQIFSIIFIFLYLLTLSECLGGARSGSGSKLTRSNYQRMPVYNGGYSQSSPKETNKTASKTPIPAKRGSGLSAWGIIAIVLSIVFFCVGTYYTFIFYPLLCKKERNYDVIELSPV